MRPDNEGSEGDYSEGGKMSDNLFCVRYSTRGTAKCKKCKSKIEKNELQMGKLVPFKAKYIHQNYHLQCLFQTFSKARVAKNVISSLDEVDGLDNIKKEDKTMINELIRNFIATQEKSLPKKRRRVAVKPNLPILENPVPQRIKMKCTHRPSMKIMFTNADQMTTTKKNELLQRIEIEKPMIVAISEMKPKIADSTQIDYNIPNYSLHPVNLANSTGRGIAVFTHSSLDKSIIQVKSKVQYEEACLLEVRLRHGDTLLFCCCYRSPTPSTTSESNNENLGKLLKSITTKKYSHVCIVGDLNYKKINWKSWTTTGSENSEEFAFIESVRDCFLHQHVEKPTRRRGDDEPSLLDLVLTNEETQVSNLRHQAPLGKSDHDTIIFDYHCYLDFTKPKEKILYNKGDFEAMRQQLDADGWREDFMAAASRLINTEDSSRVEQCWSLLKAKLTELRNQFIPKTTVSNMPSWREKGSFPIDKSTREAIKEKNRKHRAWISSISKEGRDKARLEYAKYRNKVKGMLRKAKRTFEKGISMQCKTNPKSFWAYARSKMKTKSGIAPLLSNPKDPESLRFDDQDKANILQDQFTSVFTRETISNIPDLPKRTTSIIGNIRVAEEMVLKLLQHLNISKSVGPDGMHPKILKELAVFIAGPLTQLFNMTLNDNVLPKDWKKAYVSPIFKKGARNIAVNYRPISLTSIICKIMEKVIRESLMDHLIKGKLLSRKQHGFINGRSTLTQLLSFLDACSKSIVEGNVVDVVYLDFWKAFDTVPHQRLLRKLEAYGITGNILKWIEAFLVGRSQEVVVNGVKSKLSPVLSGIPQGSVLGPLLFVVYINDILDDIKSNGLMFADDTKLFRAITSKEDAENLQQDLESLEKWSAKWSLEFNAEKCHILTLGKFENIRYTHRYKINGNELEHVYTEKDLGVTIDENLSFEDHISTKVRVANAIVGQIRSSFTFLDGPTFKRLYTAFVRPHLEYGQSAWSPHLLKYVNMLENVQIRATKLVDGFGSLDYEERLRKLDLPTLKYRRRRGDMINIFKHFNTYDQDALSNSFIPRQRTTRTHKLQMLEKVPKDGCRGLQSNGFYHRTPKLWNSLPKKVAEAKSINAFKNALDEYWKEDLYV